MVLIQSAVLRATANKPGRALGLDERTPASINAELVCCRVPLVVHVHVIVTEIGDGQ